MLFMVTIFVFRAATFDTFGCTLTECNIEYDMVVCCAACTSQCTMLYVVSFNEMVCASKPNIFNMLYTAVSL